MFLIPLLFEADYRHDNFNTLLNHYISLQSHKTNETMRVLTVISVIVLPLNLIAGIYEMNFKFMPELEWTLGYPFTIVLIALVGIGIFMFFKKRKILDHIGLPSVPPEIASSRGPPEQTYDDNFSQDTNHVFSDNLSLLKFNDFRP